MTEQQVVIGVGGSLVAVRALDRAADEAARRAAELHVVHAVPDRDQAGPVLAAAAARVGERHPGLPVVTRAARGGAVKALALESAHAALTVVGTRRHGGVGGLPAGSVSLRLAAQVRGPLLVVRGDHPCDQERRVLLGLESDADADAAAYCLPGGGAAWCAAERPALLDPPAHHPRTALAGARNQSWPAA